MRAKYSSTTALLFSAASSGHLLKLNTQACVIVLAVEVVCVFEVVCPMESAIDPSHGRSIAWLPEMDRILLVGMKHGPQGVHEATNRILSLRAGLTRADCWKRLRLLRQNGDGNHPAPRNWPTEIKELLREGYREGGKKKR